MSVLKNVRDNSLLFCGYSMFVFGTNIEDTLIFLSEEGTQKICQLKRNIF